MPPLACGKSPRYPVLEVSTCPAPQTQLPPLMPTLPARLSRCSFGSWSTTRTRSESRKSAAKDPTGSSRSLLTPATMAKWLATVAGTPKRSALSCTPLAASVECGSRSTSSSRRPGSFALRDSRIGSPGQNLKSFREAPPGANTPDSQVLGGNRHAPYGRAFVV